MAEALKISAQELTPEAREYFWHLGGEFFAEMGSTEITGADLDVLVRVSDDYGIEAAFRIRGTVTVECDRCLEPLALPVDLEFKEEELEADTWLDLRQDAYDYICTSLPIQRVHPDGECNPDALKYLAG